MLERSVKLFELHLSSFALPDIVLCSSNNESIQYYILQYTKYSLYYCTSIDDSPPQKNQAMRLAAAERATDLSVVQPLLSLRPVRHVPRQASQLKLSGSYVPLSCDAWRGACLTGRRDTVATVRLLTSPIAYRQASNQQALVTRTVDGSS